MISWWKDFFSGGLTFIWWRITFVLGPSCPDVSIALVLEESALALVWVQEDFFSKALWSCARVDMIRPGIQGSSHNIDPSDSTVLQENVILANTRVSTTSKTSTRTTRKTKPNLLHYTGPLQHHLHRATKDCCSLTLGLCPDSWSWFVFWSPFLAAL